MKILVVDDERVLVKGIKFNLESEGYQVETGYDGEEAVELARSGSFDLIILDLMMPKIDGLQACMRIREFSNVPIIMLTARSEDTDKIIGFECGADDYITKPFRPRELIARIGAAVRKSGRSPAAFEIHGLHVDTASGLVKKTATRFFSQHLNIACCWCLSATLIILSQGSSCLTNCGTRRANLSMTIP